MIWLIGNRGMLGQELSLLFQERNIPYIGTDREVDITVLGALRSFAFGKPVRWIVNCSAYTAVDKAEEEEDIARAVNADGAENIAMIASSLNAAMIHISTDYVFNGCGSRPYVEDDPIDPVGVYGKTKAEGESLVQRNWSKHFIIRTAWLYGRFGNNFVHTMLKLMKERDSINVVADQRGTPTYAADLAFVLMRVIESGANAYGTYHFTNAGETTWYEFALAVYEEARGSGLLDRKCVINPITTDQYPTKARRPAYSVLSKEKIKAVFGIRIPDWRESLHIYIQSLKKKKKRTPLCTREL